MRYRKDVLIARLTFALLIVLIIGIIVSVASRISANKKQKQVAEVVEVETQETEIVEVSETEFAEVITPTEVVETEVYVRTTVEVNFRSEPSSEGELISTIPENTELLPEDEADGWTKVTYNDQTGYINSDYLETVDPSAEGEASEIPATASIGINLRSGPGTDYEKLANIYEGDEVTILSEDGEWSEVSYNGQTGYVMTEYLMTE